MFNYVIQLKHTTSGLLSKQKILDFDDILRCLCVVVVRESALQPKPSHRSPSQGPLRGMLFFSSLLHALFDSVCTSV